MNVTRRHGYTSFWITAISTFIQILPLNVPTASPVIRGLVDTCL